MSEPVKLGPDTSWGSHLVPLMACVCATRGPILEVGMGHWSTPLLHRYCVAGGRRLVSVDENLNWVAQFTDMRVCDHTMSQVRYDQFIPDAAKREWSVVFLDHSPGWRRAQDALLFLDAVEFIIGEHGKGGFKEFRPVERDGSVYEFLFDIGAEQDVVPDSVPIACPFAHA